MSFTLAIKSQKHWFPAPNEYLYLFRANTNPNHTYPTNTNRTWRSLLCNTWPPSAEAVAT